MRGGYLVLTHVPYVGADRQVKYGVLVSALHLAGEQTARPKTHVVYFQGEQPCDSEGRVITALVHQALHQQLAPGVMVDRSFSNKPAGGFTDYFHKMTSYVSVLCGPAEVLSPGVTARTFVSETGDEEDTSPFHYRNTASTRAEIDLVTARLHGQKIAIVGLGGSGSYLLDLVAKTPVAEIHLYDGDRFYQHNAFRAPGAPTLDELRTAPFKVDHFSAVYSRMHRGIRPHPVNMEAENVEALGTVDFVFICVDKGSVRGLLVNALERLGKPFIDVGMSVEVVRGTDSLLGTVRVSTSWPENRTGREHIPMGDAERDDAYHRNIQIADLNSLNATLAVIQWKKRCGFYQDLAGEGFFAYALNVNRLVA